MNTNLQTLISLQQTTEATSAMQFLGSQRHRQRHGSATLSSDVTPATWSLNSPSPATGNVTITSSTGQTAYTGTVSLNAGSQTYTLERPGQQRRHLARRQVHARDQCDRRQRSAGHRLHADPRHRQRHQSQPESAAAHGRRPELSDQRDPIDQQRQPERAADSARSTAASALSTAIISTLSQLL